MWLVICYCCCILCSCRKAIYGDVSGGGYGGDFRVGSGGCGVCFYIILKLKNKQSNNLNNEIKNSLISDSCNASM